MPHKVVVLRTEELRPIEAAAQILSWIVYPTEKDSREQWSDAIVFLALREATRHDPRWRTEEVPIRAGILSRDVSAMERENKRASFILRDRIIAGNMALPLIARAAGVQVKLNSGGTDLPSLNKISGQVGEAIAEAKGELNGGDDSNIKNRVWNPGKPVLHFCAAMATLIIIHNFTSVNDFISNLLEDSDAIRELIEIANAYRPIIAAWRKPGPTVDETTQIELQLVS